MARVFRVFSLLLKSGKKGVSTCDFQKLHRKKEKNKEKSVTNIRGRLGESWREGERESGFIERKYRDKKKGRRKS